jgi:hypothetical protein
MTDRNRGGGKTETAERESATPLATLTFAELRRAGVVSRTPDRPHNDLPS